MFRVLCLLVACVSLSMLALLYSVFALAPVESTMGIVQKIFYIHVPSAYAMYLGFGVCALGSGMYLWKGKAHWDAWALSGAEIGLVFCIAALATGSLWARKAWGVWWTWDPRLTTTLLAGMIFGAYLALHGVKGTSAVEKRFASGLALVGLADLPIIHYSVQRWRGQHPTVISGRGQGLDPTMAKVFALGMVTFTLLFLLLLLWRWQVQRHVQSVQEVNDNLKAEQWGVA